MLRRGDKEGINLASVLTNDNLDKYLGLLLSHFFHGDFFFLFSSLLCALMSIGLYCCSRRIRMCGIARAIVHKWTDRGRRRRRDRAWLNGMCVSQYCSSSISSHLHKSLYKLGLTGVMKVQSCSSSSSKHCIREIIKKNETFFWLIMLLGKIGINLEKS